MLQSDCGHPQRLSLTKDVLRILRDLWTILAYELRGRAFVDVTLGSLDNLEALSLTRATWCAEALAWSEKTHYSEHCSRGSLG